MSGKLLREVVGDETGAEEGAVPLMLVEVPDEVTGRVPRARVLDGVDRAIDDVLDSVTNES